MSLYLLNVFLMYVDLSTGQCAHIAEISVGSALLSNAFDQCKLKNTEIQQFGSHDTSLIIFI